MDANVVPLHPFGMAKQKHFLREWRKHKSLTLEQLADRMGGGITHATLSRIERGKLPYYQHLLEALAEIYGTDPASLLVRDPSQGDGIWSIWETLEPVEQRQAVEVIKAIKRTGTDG